MHKLTKGLKKKKKGKKSKHKEEELFKPEELEAYRREHAAAGEDSAAKNEEWRNFLSLTSGVDDILKKTQDDLDRIKSTSFFQRIPTKSEAESKKRAVEEAQLRLAEAQREQACAARRHEEPQLGIVPVSESESEEEEDDDVFDTAYIDAIATGEVKLAYIPESPTDKPDGDDPFDTSIAERAILGPAVSRKGTKLVPLGAAVEVLTGRVQLPTCATKTVARRQILKEQNLLLGSFDSAPPQPTVASQAQASPEQIRTLLDDGEVPLPDEPIDLSRSLYIPPAPPTGAALEEDEDDKEFEALAAESLSKTAPRTGLPQPVVPVVEALSDWKPFGSEAQPDLVPESDPFDTTFADNILPGKAELRLIEKDILENDVDFDPRASDSYTSLQKPLNGKVPESELKLIAPVQRDLLGGSTSDLSHLGDQPILPIEDDIKYCDPFDTSIVEAVKAPGQAELKYIEKELLGDLPATEEDDFDPRALESKPRTLSRPDVLNVSQAKTVSFSVPIEDLLGPDEGLKVAKPLTPFYVRKNSVPADQDPFDTSSKASRQESVDLLADTNRIAAKVLTPHAPTEDPIAYADPFDTSIATNILPGKAELRLLENELIEARVEVHDNDLLVHGGDTIIEKPLSPQLGKQADIEETDPFDTSFASNIQPGRAELKVLESELI